MLAAVTWLIDRSQQTMAVYKAVQLDQQLSVDVRLLQIAEDLHSISNFSYIGSAIDLVSDLILISSLSQVPFP